MPEVHSPCGGGVARGVPCLLAKPHLAGVCRFLLNRMRLAAATTGWPLQFGFVRGSSGYFVNHGHDYAGEAYKERQPGYQLCASLSVLLFSLLLVSFLGFVDKLLVFKVTDTFFVITFHR